MTAYKQVVALLGKNPASLLQLLSKLFVDWKLDFQKFLHMLQNLKKEQIIGLMDGTCEVVKKVKENLFNFSEFFTTKPGLFIYEDSRMEAVRQAYPNPIPYKSVENLESAFDLDRNMYDKEIIEKLGGEENVRKNAVTMDQIEQLIKNQWGGKAGVMLNNGFANIFYVVEKNNQLFAVFVCWDSDSGFWIVVAFKVDEDGDWDQGARVFSNKNLVS